MAKKNKKLVTLVTFVNGKLQTLERNITKNKKIKCSEDFLTIVKGDPLSEKLLEAAKKYNFKGKIMVLDDAEYQRGPLPHLSVGRGSYGPQILYVLIYQKKIKRLFYQ